MNPSIGRIVVVKRREEAKEVPDHYDPAIVNTVQLSEQTAPALTANERADGVPVNKPYVYPDGTVSKTAVEMCPPVVESGAPPTLQPLYSEESVTPAQRIDPIDGAPYGVGRAKGVTEPSGWIDATVFAYGGPPVRFVRDVPLFEDEESADVWFEAQSPRRKGTPSDPDNGSVAFWPTKLTEDASLSPSSFAEIEAEAKRVREEEAAYAPLPDFSGPVDPVDGLPLPVVEDPANDVPQIKRRIPRV